VINNQNIDPEPSSSIETTATSRKWRHQPLRIWNDLSIRAKITTLLIIGAVIPIVIVTQGIVGLARETAMGDLKDSLKTKLLILEKSVKSEIKQIEDSSNILAQSVIAAGINLDDVGVATSQKDQLTSFIQTAQKLKPNASFYLITNNQGQTVAQSVQIVKADFSKYSLLPSEQHTSKIATTQFNPVSSSASIALGDLSIVQTAFAQSRSLAGVELLQNKSLQQLGLSPQADIGVRAQATTGLPEAKKPYPAGTFNIDNGKIGLVLMSVCPIRLNGKQVGSAIVGTLINHNYDIVDKLKSETGISTATLFAQDWRVSTNVPYTDKTTRALGTRVSKVVADQVLKEKKVFIGDANIIGINYVTGYAPLYDHHQQLNPANARPIGIAYVGEPQTKVDQNLQKTTLTGYAIGGVILLMAILLLTPSHRSISRPIRRLTAFAEQIAAGKSGVRVRLADNERQDELGVLSRNLNLMAQNIDNNVYARQQEIAKQYQQRKTLEVEISKLVEEIEAHIPPSK
jgi:methyl-accepting chemotaxis protein PixJ